MRDLPLSERPREKLCRQGPKALSDRELLAVVLGSGTRKRGVLWLADEILKKLDGTDRVTPECLREIEGVGPARAMKICAALEFARRRIRPEGVKIVLAVDALPLVRHYADRKQEHFLCISLNGANEVIATRVVSVGLVNRTQVHPREVFADPIADRAVSVIVAHNHPSGTPAPSSQDVEVTRRLKAAGDILGISLIDHIIFTRNSYYSFQEHNKV
ncbi:MAG: DNA repair protein RadC [Acidobacteriota bacterium]